MGKLYRETKKEQGEIEATAVPPWPRENTFSPCQKTAETIASFGACGDFIGFGPLVQI